MIHRNKDTDMTLRATLSAALLGLTAASLSAPLQAAEPAEPVALPLTYEIFEAAVPHLDLDECPVTLPQLDSFCRATVLHNEIHIFAFSTEGDSPMIGFNSHAAENLAELLH